MFNPSFPPFNLIMISTRSSAFLDEPNNFFVIACIPNPFEINGKDKEARDKFFIKLLLFIRNSYFSIILFRTVAF